MGGYSAFYAAQTLGKEKVKCCLMMDPDWCAIEDEELEDKEDNALSSEVPMCIINSLSDLNDETYVNHKERLSKVWTEAKCEYNESYIMPGIGHVDFTDTALIDPFWTCMLNGDR